jgi:hypothetical protein
VSHDVFLVVAAVVATMIVIRFVARSPKGKRPTFSTKPDLPSSFSYKAAWIAVKGAAPERVAAALRLADVQPCNWDYGLMHAYSSPSARNFATIQALVADELRFGATPYVFVSPPTDGWTFAVGQRLAYMGSFAFKALGPDHAPGKLLPFLERLSAELDTTVHYFFTHRVPETHVWVRSDRGMVVRAYGVGRIRRGALRRGATDQGGVRARMGSSDEGRGAARGGP